MVKNKKGFTLVELLTVIAIIGIIGVIVGVTVTNSIARSKNDLSKVQEQNLISAAKSYLLENSHEFLADETPDVCSDVKDIDTNIITRKCNISLETLIDSKYINNPKNFNTKKNQDYYIFAILTIYDGSLKDSKYYVVNADKSNLLVDRILYSNGGKENIQKVDTPNNRVGLYKTKDNDGDTYYFTGEVGNNYVVFGDYGNSLPNGHKGGAGIVSAKKYVDGGYANESSTSVVKVGDMYKYLWRIVRINGDGSIRLALNSLINYNDRLIKENGWNHWNIKGWEYGESATYENSQMDTDLQYWYDNRKLNKSGIVVPSKYCVDTSRTISGNSLSYTCNNEITRNIGLLTQSDLEYSGISADRKDLSTANRSYLDFDLITRFMSGSNSRVYTMTPGSDGKWNALSIIQTCPEGTTEDFSSSSCVKSDGTKIYMDSADIDYISMEEINTKAYVRPVINLKKEVKVSSGNGTYVTPYVIQY